jgi:hypothetical protein
MLLKEESPLPETSFTEDPLLREDERERRDGEQAEEESVVPVVKEPPLGSEAWAMAPRSPSKTRELGLEPEKENPGGSTAEQDQAIPPVRPPTKK